MAHSDVEVIRTVAALRARVGSWRRQGDTVGLVPTMGALHEGHLTLVDLARRRSRRTVTSIFVNPAQFAPHEDFAKYPRTFDTDLAQLADAGCNTVWAPTVAEMYPDGFATTVVPAGAAVGLETDFRPQFFAGVATVCCKLFTQVAPDVAVFGEKDYQQLCVIRQMVRDLDLPLEIAAAPTVRAADGLAMSSRNAYLSSEQRALAPMIHRTLVTVAERIARGDSRTEAEAAAGADLTDVGFKVDYVAVRDAETLAVPAHVTGRPLRILAAAWLGKTRLIDNIAAG
jgi:pantoate--beta-alanine ligase